jgi:hypothetical protein
MTLSSDHGRRAFALEIGGLEYRYHSGAGTTGLDADVISGIPFINREGIVSVGAFSASVDPSGGIAQYSPVSVSLSIDRKADSGDAGVIFGRCGARSASTRARLTSSLDRTSFSIGVDTDLSSLTFPKLMHIGAETVAVSSATSTTLTATRGVRSTPQTHSIGLEGSIVPEVTLEITTFRGRRAALWMAHQYPDGSLSSWSQIINGFIESSPVIEEGDTISLSIAPLTALIDTDLSDKGINQTRLLQGYHYFDGRNGSAIEYALRLSHDEHDRPRREPFGTPTGTITAGAFKVESYNSNEFDDFDVSLPTGADDYLFEHPRFPRLRPDDGSFLTSPSVYPTAITSTASGFDLTADTTPSDSLLAAQIQAADYLYLPMFRYELKQHQLGLEEIKPWPQVLNDTLESVGPIDTQGLSGGVAKWKLTPDNRAIVSKLSDSRFTAAVFWWLFSDSINREARALSDIYPLHFDANGTNTALFYDLRCWYPLDFGWGEYNFNSLDGVTSSAGVIRGVTTSSRTLGGSFQLRDVARAYYQQRELGILVEGGLGLPTSPTAGVYYDLTIVYYDHQTRQTKRQTIQATHQEDAIYDSSTIGTLIHLRQDQAWSHVVSFGDWTDTERALIFRGGQYTGERPGVALLRLLESGGGLEVNGDYDTLNVGLNISSADIDEASFLSIDSTSPFTLTEQFAGDGTDLRTTFESVLRLLGAALVMKRDVTGRAKLTLISVGADRARSVSADIQEGDWLTDPPPSWDVYEDIVTQIRYEYDYDPELTSYESEVIFNNSEAINRYGGERSAISLKLSGISSRQFGRNAGDIFDQFLPTSSRLFNLLSNPLRVWRGHIGTGQSIYLDVGSYVQCSSPHLRGYSDQYGVTDQVGMVRAMHQELMGEGCELEVITTGLSPVAWNASALVSQISSSTVVKVAESEFSSAAIDDVSFFAAGDRVDYIPVGDQDNAITGLTINAIAGNLIQFTTAHGITAVGGTLEPSTYAYASTLHRSDAYLANSSDIIDTTTPAQEYS